MQPSTQATDSPSSSGGRGRLIAYWLVSVPVLAETAVGIQWDLWHVQYVTEILARIGFPEYFATILGVAKILALAAILVPGTPRIKEWAYAGIFFVYAGAAACHVAIGDSVGNIVTPLVFAAITLVSWALRPPGRRDPGPLPRSLRLARD